MVHCSFLFRVDVGLRKDFVDGVDCGEGVWVRTWHALDFDTVVIAIAIHREQTLQLPLCEPVMNLDRKLVHNMLLVSVLPIQRLVKPVHICQLTQRLLSLLLSFSLGLEHKICI